MLLAIVRVIVGVVVALVLIVIGYTYYENTFTPAAIPSASSLNRPAVAPGQLSPTAMRALQAYGGETVWKNATRVESTVTVGGLLFQIKGAGIPPHATITTDL